MTAQKQKKPPFYDAVMRSAQPRAFFRLPQCPACGTQLRYRRVVARLPVFTERCNHCGAPLRCRAGLRSAVLALVLVALACGLTALLAHVTDRLLPIVFFTLLLVVAAYFLWPLTLHSGVPKRKK